MSPLKSQLTHNPRTQALGLKPSPLTKEPLQSLGLIRPGNPSSSEKPVLMLSIQGGGKACFVPELLGMCLQM